MSFNPYQSPGGDFSGNYQAGGRVNGPASALMIVTILSLVCLLMAFVFDIFMLVTGFGMDGGNELGMSKSEELIVRMMLATLVIAVNGIILYGAMQMKSLSSLGMAKTACILALIPCCGPCYILGIPFGIWGLIVLSDPQVQRAFKG